MRRARFCCLKQDGQDGQDLQDERQVREDLNVYRRAAGNKRLRSDRTLIRRSGFCGALRGTGPRATVKEARRPGHRSAGACPPQSLPHPVHPAHPGHPASDVIAIKVLTDLFSLLRLRSIDIKVFQTFSPASWPS